MLTVGVKESVEAAVRMRYTNARFIPTFHRDSSMRFFVVRRCSSIASVHAALGAHLDKAHPVIHNIWCATTAEYTARGGEPMFDLYVYYA